MSPPSGEAMWTQESEMASNQPRRPGHVFEVPPSPSGAQQRAAGGLCQPCRALGPPSALKTTQSHSSCSLNRSTGCPGLEHLQPDFLPPLTTIKDRIQDGCFSLSFSKATQSFLPNTSYPVLEVHCLAHYKLCIQPSPNHPLNSQTQF